MEKLKLPEGYQPITPYLILDDAGEFFKFMQTVFGAEYASEPVLDGDNVVYGHLMINGGQIMYSNSKTSYPAQPSGIFIYVKNCDETFSKAIDAGATVIDEPTTQSYGRAAGVKDPFGNSWWLTSL